MDKYEREQVAIICPYCGTRQLQHLKRTVRPQVVLCDCENYPGCDRYFAVSLRIEHKLQYYAMSEKGETNPFHVRPTQEENDA